MFGHALVLAAFAWAAYFNTRCLWQSASVNWRSTRRETWAFFLSVQLLLVYVAYTLVLMVIGG